jgi:hypothetical protein
MSRDFRGDHERVDFANIKDMTNNPITLSCMISFDNIGLSSQYIFCIHNSADNQAELIIWHRVDGIRFTRFGDGIHDGMYYERYGTGSPSNYQWYHLLVRNTGFSDSNANNDIFIDGVEPSSLDNNLSGSEFDSDGSWSFGGRIQDNNRNFDGNMEQIGIWDRFLTDDECSALFKLISPLAIPKNLLYYSHFSGRRTNEFNYMGSLAAYTHTDRSSYRPAINDVSDR